MQRPIVFVVALVAVLIGIAALSAWPPAASVAPLAAAHEADGASAVVAAPRAGVREDPTSLGRERDVPAAPPALVRIVDEHGTPVAGAEVAFDASAELVAAEAPLPFDVEQRLADAAHVRSGDDGVVRLATDATCARVVARFGERFGQRVMQFDDPWCDVPDLCIAPDRNLEVVVVGPRGEPRANVPVDADFLVHDRRVDGAVRTFELPFSDANGRVMLWHVQTLDFWPAADPAVTLRAPVLGARSTDVRVELAAALTEPVRLPCAEHGAIRVRTWVAPGIPGSGPCPPEIHMESGVRFEPTDYCAERVFRALAVGREWRVETLGFPDARTMVRDGEVVDVDLVARERSVLVQLLRPDGRVAANEPTRVGARYPPPARTSAEGVVGFVLSRELEGNSTTLEAPALNASAEVDIEGREPDTRGVIDLGVVRLQARRSSPLFATGRVIDARTGRPLWAGVTPEREADFDVDMDGGAFRILGESNDPVRVEISRSGYAREKVVVNPGDDVLIALRRFPHLHLTLLVDSSIDLASIAARLRYSFAEHELWNARRTTRTEGRIECTFDVETDDDITLQVDGAWFGGDRDGSLCDLGSGPPPLASVPRRDWRVDPDGFAVTVDLRGALEQIEITPHPRTAWAMLFVRAASTQGRCGRLTLDGRAHIVVPRGVRLDGIAVPAHGFAREALLAPGANELVFPPQARVLATIENVSKEVVRSHVKVRMYAVERREPLLDRLAAGEGMFAWQPRPWPKDGGSLRPEGSDEGVNRDGPSDFSVSERGRYAVIPYVDTVPFLDAAVPVDVNTPGETISVTIHLDPEQVRDVLRARDRR